MDSVILIGGYRAWGHPRSGARNDSIFRLHGQAGYRQKLDELGKAVEAAVMRSRVARMVGLVAVGGAIVAGCSTSPASTATASGSHLESHTQGILTYTVKWRVHNGQVQIDGFRASFKTCHRTWIFFSTCGRGLVNPQVSFAIYSPTDARLWGQSAPVTRQPDQMTLARRLEHMTAADTLWLPKGGALAVTFPQGSFLRVQLYGFNDWNSIEEGGDQFYGVAGTGASTVLG